MKMNCKCACGKQYKVTWWLNRHQRRCAIYQETPMAQLNKITREVFFPKLRYEIYKRNPLLDCLVGNSEELKIKSPVFEVPDYCHE